MKPVRSSERTQDVSTTGRLCGRHLPGGLRPACRSTPDNRIPEFFFNNTLMLYYLIDYLEQLYQPPGFQVIRFITVRATLGAITALFISLFIGRRIINMLSAKQLGESVREGALAGVVDHTHKAGTPTMGGAIIILSILLSTFLWGAIAEPYVWLAMLAMAWMGVFGFMDDYIKTFRKDKRGLAPKVKLAGQISIGLLIGAALCFHPAFEAYNALTYVPFPEGQDDQL